MQENNAYFWKGTKSCIKVFGRSCLKMQNFKVAQKWNAESAKTKVAQNTALECQLIFYRVGIVFRILA